MESINFCLLQEVKREGRRIQIDGCRYNERLWSVGGKSPGQTRKKPKDLSAREREEGGRGEGGVLYKRLGRFSSGENKRK